MLTHTRIMLAEHTDRKLINTKKRSGYQTWKWLSILFGSSPNMNFQDMSNLGSIFTCFLLKSSKGVDNCRFQVFGGCWGNASYLAVMSVHLFSFWHLPIGVDNCRFQVFGGCWGNASHPVVMSVQQKNEFVEGIHLFQWQCQLRERMDLKFCKLVRLSVESGNVAKQRDIRSCLGRSMKKKQTLTAYWLITVVVCALQKYFNSKAQDTREKGGDYIIIWFSKTCSSFKLLVFYYI